MAVLFSSDTFIPAIIPGENFLKIRDISGNIRYKLYNNAVSNIYVNLDTVLIKTESDTKTLQLKFQTRTEALTGGRKLEEALTKIKENFQVLKDSKFSDLSFEIYNDVDRAISVNFNLNNQTTAKTLIFGEGSVLQTEAEVAATLNDVTTFRYFEHFLLPHKLVQGSFSGGVIKTRANEIGHAGIIELSISTSASDAYLWSNINAFQLNDSAKFSTAFRITTLADSLDNYRIVIGFFNQNNISSISKGAHFTFDYSLNNNWLVKTLDSTSTIQNTLVPLDTNWHTYACRFNLAHELEFLIDDVVVSMIDTNIPTTFGSEVSFGVLFEKIDSTQNTSVLVDWMKFEIDL